MKKFFTGSICSYILCCLLLLASVLYVHKCKDTWGWNIAWDVSGYYMYLPGIFYDDLGELHNQQYIIDTYHPCGNDLNQFLSPTGKYIIKYSGGMAVMYLPGFLIGHLYAKLGNYPVDGFSMPYQFSMSMYSLLVAFTGLWFARKLLLKYFSEWSYSAYLIQHCFCHQLPELCYGQ